MKQLLLFFLITIEVGHALVPIEGIIYGDVKDIKQNDPFVGMLTSQYFVTKSKDQKYNQLLYYIALNLQGQNLAGSCNGFEKLNYSAFWKEDTAKRSVVALLQYLGLDLSLRSIVNYSKDLNLSASKYNLLVDNLIENGCSENISVYSKKYLKANFRYYWDHDTSFKNPHLKDNPYFPQAVVKAHNTLQTKQREFEYSVRSFKSLCSWNLDTDDLGEVTEYLKNPFIMSFLINNAIKKEIGIDEKTKEFAEKDSDQGVQVACENMICRKVNQTKFEKLFPLMQGSSSIRDDLKNLYCGHFSKLRNKKRVKTNYSKYNEASHFLSLITGVPEIHTMVESFDESLAFIKSNIIERWDHWALARSDKLNIEQLYEERLELTLRPQADTYDIEVGKFNLKFDIHLGEFDKVVQDLDKITSVFYLNLPKTYIEYLKKRIPFLYNSGRLKELAEVEQRFIQTINHQLKDKEDYFSVPLWNERFSKIIVNELVQQFIKGRLYLRNVGNKKFVKIPVTFFYGTFALQYIHKKYIFKNETQEKLSLK